MGGAKEDKLPVTTQTKTGKTVGSVRFHGSGGEVHFHDDISKVKCAVPFGEFYDAWQRFQCQTDATIHFSDAVNHSEIDIVRSTNRPLDYDEVDLRITLRAVKHGPGFAALQQFMSR